MADRQDLVSRAIQDRFRCPQDFVGFTLRQEPPSTKDDAPLNGRSAGSGRSGLEGLRAAGDFFTGYESLSNVVNGDGEFRLPFDPNEVIDSLRLERYWRAPYRRSDRLLKDIYYWLRPLTNQSIRRGIQKFRARNWRKAKFPRWPVDTTVENICENLLLLALQVKGVERIPFVWFWPSGARACVTMTHDVETETGRDFCGDLMSIDDAFGIKASFQIVPEDRYTVSAQFLDMLRRRGFEIGVQDLNHDGRLFDSREGFLRRVQDINRYGREYGARGFRAGVLYRNPEWYDALEFSFDMSMPNVAHFDPQGGGCCTVMPYFIGNVLELPVTTTQDYTLFHLLNQHSIDLWKTQTELILRKHGLVSFIIHPDYVIDPKPNYVYRELLGYLRTLRENENVWFALPTAIDHWWRARSKMLVVPYGGSYRIEGEGAKHAVLAFAKNVNGRLEYEFPARTT